jgi:hypothetical protein
VDHWYRVVKATFPIYVQHWSKHPDVTNRTPLLQEQVFDVPYQLPSGRTVRLRGKWDSVDRIESGIFLQENKTKGDVYIERIQRQLAFDLQTMFYLVALSHYAPDDGKTTPCQEATGARFGPIRGVRYNVIRRPLSGGKGSIVRHKPTKKNPRGESKDEFYQRLSGIIGGSPEEYFWRWKAGVSSKEIEAFRQLSLDPIIETVACWYASRTGQPTCGSCEEHSHWRHPFGVYNVLDEGGASDLDEYLATGSMVGLRRVDRLFEEL